MITSFRSKPLATFAQTGDGSKLPVPASSHSRVRLLLNMLNDATTPEDMKQPGVGFHGLQGKPKRYAAKVTVNYRITFGWDAGDAVAVDLEDYH